MAHEKANPTIAELIERARAARHESEELVAEMRAWTSYWRRVLDKPADVLPPPSPPRWPGSQHLHA